MSDISRLRYLRINDSLIGFYAGRDAVPARFYPEKNWIDDSTLPLGVCSYALIDGDAAIIYDTQISPEFGHEIRRTLETLGIRHIKVVLSHWHLDHVAGLAAFADCPIIATRTTHDLMVQHRAMIEAGTCDGPPAINPLILPTETFEGTMALSCGTLNVDLLEVNVHTPGAALAHVPSLNLILCGDTLEDPLTWIGEPQDLALHLADLDVMFALGPVAYFPAHGNPETIEQGGYRRNFVRATQLYLRTLLRARDDAELRGQNVREWLAGPLGADWIRWFDAYEAVHAQNLAQTAHTPHKLAAHKDEAPT